MTEIIRGDVGDRKKGKVGHKFNLVLKQKNLDEEKKEKAFQSIKITLAESGNIKDLKSLFEFN